MDVLQWNVGVGAAYDGATSLWVRELFSGLHRAMLAAGKSQNEIREAFVLAGGCRA